MDGNPTDSELHGFPGARIVASGMKSDGPRSVSVPSSGTAEYPSDTRGHTASAEFRRPRFVPYSASPTYHDGARPLSQPLRPNGLPTRAHTFFNTFASDMFQDGTAVTEASRPPTGGGATATSFDSIPQPTSLKYDHHSTKRDPTLSVEEPSSSVAQAEPASFPFSQGVTSKERQSRGRPSPIRISPKGVSGVVKKRTRNKSSPTTSLSAPLSRNQPSRPFASGAELYLVTESYVYYDPRLNTNEDYMRLYRRTDRELYNIGPACFQVMDIPDVNISWFPLYPCVKELQRMGAEHTLMSLVIECADYDNCRRLIENGTIQVVLSAYRKSQQTIERLLLLLLLREASCVLETGELFKRSASELYDFCFGILSAENVHLDSLITEKRATDIRVYSYMLVIAYAVHSRRIFSDYRRLQGHVKALYRSHASLVINAFQKLFEDAPRTYTDELPKYMKQLHESLTSHDIAAEVFVDFAKYGLFQHCAAELVNLHWLRVIGKYLKTAPFNMATIQLHELLLQGPRNLACLTNSSTEFYKECWSCLSWSLGQIMDNEYYRNPENPTSAGQQKPAVPFLFAATCAQLLVTLMKTPFHELVPYSEMANIMQTQASMGELVTYVLSIPFFVDLEQNEEHFELFEAVWALIFSCSYTFPLMSSTLMELAIDDMTPLCLSGHIAMFLGGMTAFGQIPRTREEVFLLRERLRDFAAMARNHTAEMCRRELAFRLTVLLEERKYKQVKGPKADDESRVPGDLFIPYEFEPTHERKMIPAIDLLELLDNGNVVRLDMPLLGSDSWNEIDQAYARRKEGADDLHAFDLDCGQDYDTDQDM